MFEFFVAVFAVVGIVSSVVSRVKMMRAQDSIRALNHKLDLALENVKFGPEGEAVRRETAERIWRIRS